MCNLFVLCHYTFSYERLPSMGLKVSGIAMGGGQGGDLPPPIVFKTGFLKFKFGEILKERGT